MLIISVSILHSKGDGRSVSTPDTSFANAPSSTLSTVTNDESYEIPKSHPLSPVSGILDISNVNVKLPPASAVVLLIPTPKPSSADTIAETETDANVAAAKSPAITFLVLICVFLLF